MDLKFSFRRNFRLNLIAWKIKIFWGPSNKEKNKRKKKDMKNNTSSLVKDF